MMFTLKFRQKRETKGTIVYEEVEGEDGNALALSEAVIGTIYIRKSKIQPAPQALTITIEEG